MAVTAGLIAGATLPAMRAVAATRAQQERFTNQVIWQDFADLEVIRVGDTYYYTGSTMHYSPGAPVLRSYDLVNWEFIGHSVPVLDFSDAYDQRRTGVRRGHLGVLDALPPQRQDLLLAGPDRLAAVVRVQRRRRGGPWTRHAVIGSIYYDAGLLFDDDGTPYVAYGANEIRVARLAPDMRSEVRSEHVLTKPAEFGLNGGLPLLQDQR